VEVKAVVQDEAREAKETFGLTDWLLRGQPVMKLKWLVASEILRAL
jgi:hypothetical protein